MEISGVTRSLIGLVSLGILCVLIYVLRSKTDSRSTESPDDFETSRSSNASSSEDVDSDPAPPPPSRGDDRIMVVDVDVDVGEQLLISVKPDMPRDDAEPTSSPFSPEFEEQLFLAARFNGSPEESCLQWSRILPLSLRDKANKKERSLGLFNVIKACSNEGGIGENELRLANESLHRFRELATSTEEVVRKVEGELGIDEERAYILFVDVHPPDTEVSLDGVAACAEPCALAIPLDGEAHLMGFKHAGSEARLTWRPSSLDAPPPTLPTLP